MKNFTQKEKAEIAKYCRYHKNSRVVIYECCHVHPQKEDHHFDYDFPLLVIRVCPSCHQTEHNRLGLNYSLEEKGFEFKPEKEISEIRTAIFELGLTQKKISRKIGKPESVVSEVLRGRKKAHPTFCLIKSFLATEILNRRN